MQRIIHPSLFTCKHCHTTYTRALSCVASTVLRVFWLAKHYGNASCMFNQSISYLFKWVLIPRALVWRNLGPLMDLLPGTIRSGAATGFCCNNDDKFTSLSCLAALAYIKKLLCNINKWREQSVLCTAQTRPQSIYRGLCGVRRAVCLIWTCL